MFCLDSLVFRSPESVRGWAGWSWLLVKKENEKPSPRGTRPDREEGERRLKVCLREGLEGVGQADAAKDLRVNNRIGHDVAIQVVGVVNAGSNTAGLGGHVFN
jgi:hypothetical protein